jgi:hypothetical protein
MTDTLTNRAHRLAGAWDMPTSDQPQQICYILGILRTYLVLCLSETSLPSGRCKPLDIANIYKLCDKTHGFLRTMKQEDVRF